MRELPDKALDDYIARALKSQAAVSDEQRKRAWAALQQKLPASYLLPAEKAPLLPVVHPLKQLQLLVFAFVASLFADETIYQRARSAPRPSHRRYSSYYREFSPAG